MFSTWFQPNNQEASKNQEFKSRHYILGSSLQAPINPGQEEILFACGCFWGAEKCFWKLPGVITTSVGFAGGKNKQPSYNQVCTGMTGHTEVVRVVWNPSIIDLSDLLKMFWECHNPTQGNRQGNDRGSQYRSAIYTTSEKQMELVLSSKESYQKLLMENGLGSITTEIKSGVSFYIAESYHQQYLAKPGSRPYCSAMPTKIPLGDFKGANYKLSPEVWSNFDWKVNHCVLRSDNDQIQLN